jgi:hypothetical protein
MKNVPFTKRSLTNLCSKLNREQSDNDAKKTMDIFAELKASDPEFNSNVQVDREIRVKTLMWVSGRSHKRCAPGHDPPMVQMACAAQGEGIFWCGV